MLCLRSVGKSRLALLVLLALASTAAHAVAAPPTEPATRARAAELYDRAVALYEKGRYAEAANAFFEADMLAPSADALSSAIAAARLAHDDLLVARAAQRAVERESSDPKLAGDARAALSEAETHLARLDLACEPEPCELHIDSTRVSAGRHYLLPGTHVLTTKYPEAGAVEQRATFAAGSLYTITLSPAPRETPARRPASAEAKPTAPVRSLPPNDAPSSARPLPAWVFYAGAGASLALAGVTVWSGVDALDDVDHFKATRRAGDRDGALSSVRRTDALLAGSALLAAATAYAGLRLVDFGAKERAITITLGRDQAALTWSGRL